MFGTTTATNALTLSFSVKADLSSSNPAPTREGSWTFSAGDFVELPSLAGKLKQPGRAVDKWLAGQLSPATKAALSSYADADSDPASLQAALLQDLNELLADTSIHERQRFEGVTLHSETQKLLSQNPQGEDLVRLNRLLIEDAYPLELSRIPLIALRTRAQMPMPLPIGTRGDRTVTNLAQLEAPVNGKPDRDWCWEGFFFVRMTDGITNAAPVVVNLEVREDEGEWEREVDLVLGDCWLFAGGPNVGTLLRNPNSGTNVALLATGSTVTNEGPLSCAAFSPKARDKLKLKGGPQSPSRR